MDISRDQAGLELRTDANYAEQLAHARKTSMDRAAALVASIAPDLNARDDRIAAELARENASAKAKLGKLYRLAAEFAQAAVPFVPCSKGCAGCCKMNVSITSIEAQRLAAVSGKTMVDVRSPVTHSEAEFSGIPCPFLVDEVCSVYEVRPYACRAHFSFDVSSYWCQPERAYEDGMGVVELGGAKRAYVEIATKSPMGGFADIRDFFPVARESSKG
jgi:Fe-S-cluster containining protein